MAGTARAFDIWAGICCCHKDPICIPMSGPIITYSSNVKLDGRGMARHLDMVIGFCGHPGIIISSSSDTKCNGRGVARLTDSVVGCTVGAIITCSPNTKSN